MKNWKKKEKSDRELFGGRIQTGSGNQWAQPGDIKTSNLLIDSKYTSRKSFSITKEIWDKLYEEALLSFRYPMLSLKIQDIELVVMGKDDFMKLFGFKLDK